jgi:branched-subunit amino acid aminotransferase/4-amino-4-deoxychorismate lyase
MTEPLVFIAGRLIPQREAVLPIHDAGLVSGVTVTDFCRTFRHKLFRWPDHLARFRHDCAACYIPLIPSDPELTALAQQLVEHNARLLAPNGELALITFATPGPLGAYIGEPGVDGPPTLVMHTFPLSFARYRPFFTDGVSLAVVEHHAYMPHVKQRSRLHWWRAERMVPKGSVPILLNPQTGCFTETAIGNLLVVRDGIVSTPPRGTVLDSISVRVVKEICGELRIPFEECRLTFADMQAASEVMLAGTAFCLAGVRSLEKGDIPNMTPLCQLMNVPFFWPVPGPVLQRLLAVWSDKVDLDVWAQFVEEH